jgi:hypothetical protein
MNVSLHLSHTPSDTHPCAGCEAVHQSINGYYCAKLHSYVEHTKEKPCTR